MSRTIWIFAGFVALAAVPVGSSAQSKVELAPHIGFYLPLKAAVRESTPEGATLLEKRQVGALAFGGRMAVRTYRRLWTEVTLNYSPSLTAVSENNRTFDNDGGVFLASARAVWRIARSSGKPGAPQFQLGSGAALINRFGKAWDDHTGTTDLAWVNGVAARVPLGKTSPIQVRFEIENYTSRVQFGVDGAVTRARLNHDLIWSLGFEIPMRGDSR